MSTFQTGATYLGYALNKSSDWNSGYASQGAAKAGQPRDGLMLFGNLRTSVAWGDQSVTEVKLYLKYGTAGSDRSKTIGLYASSRNSAGGVGSAVRGAYFGTFAAGAHWGGDATYTFSEESNPTVFAGLKEWIETGSTFGLVMFMNESDSSNYTTNFLNVSSASLTITYEVKGSKGTITPDPVDIGSEALLHIDAVTSSQSVTHIAEFAFGNQTSGALAIPESTVDFSYTIPTSWLGELADASSGTATCTLTTFIGGVESGSREIAFTVTVPDQFAPSISMFNVERYSSYIDDQGKTQYRSDMQGGNVWVTLTAQMDTSSGLTPELSLAYWPSEDETNVTTVNVPWTGTGSPSVMQTVEDRSILPAAISIASAWVFELTFSNGKQAVVVRAAVQKSQVTAHFAGTGFGVGIGMFSPGTEASPSFDVAWKSNFHGGSSGLFDVVYDSGVQTKSNANNTEVSQLSYTIEEDGIYMVIGRGSFPTGTGGAFRFMAIKYGATGTENELTAQTNPPQSSAGPRTSCMGIEQFTAGQVVTLRFNQNSGSAVNITMRMWIVKIGGQYA